MSHLVENIYDIKDLYIVRLGINNIEEDEYIKYFNQDYNFIVEKFSIDKGSELPYYFETYTECFTGHDIFRRESETPFSSIPAIFSNLEKIPIEYFTEEEKKEGKITAIRLFQVFQEVNTKAKRLVR